MKIDLNLLPVFIAVAEERNFTIAAARLGLRARRLVREYGGLRILSAQCW
jgi:DNA-binding transcriptional LysR family regulator